jgi:hypothetical protein
MLILYALFAAFAVAEATNISGNWSLTMKPDFRGNPNVVSQCILRQSGTKLTVRCGTGSELTGSVKGRTVTWGFTPKNGDKYPAFTHTGTLNEAGTAIKGTWHLSIVDEEKDGEFTATKRRPTSDR